MITLELIMANVTRKKKGQYHHGDLRDALIRAAIDLVAESGVEGFTLREAAKRAGVSAAAPYRHFADRASLLVAVAEEGFAILLPLMRAKLERHSQDSLATLAELGVTFVEFGALHPSHFQLMYGPPLSDRASHPPLGDLDLEGFHMLTPAITRAQQEGKVREGDARQMALVCFALVYGAVTIYLDGEMGRLGFSPSQAQSTLDIAGLYMLQGLTPG